MKERRKRWTPRVPPRRLTIDTAGPSNLHGIFKKADGRSVYEASCYDSSEADIDDVGQPKEVVRACVPPTMYSASTFRAHNNGPRWWNEAHDIWMGRTAHSAGRSAAQTARSTLLTPLSNATRYGSTPTIGKLRYGKRTSGTPHHSRFTAFPYPTRATFCSDASCRVTPTNQKFWFECRNISGVEERYQYNRETKRLSRRGKKAADSLLL
jgi:hypothetical protein